MGYGGHRRGALLLLIVLPIMLLTSSAYAGGARYRFGFMAGTGNAFVPRTSDGGLVTAVTYHEYGGVLTKLIFIALTTPTEPAPHLRQVESETECTGRSCWTTTTYEVVSVPSEADWARYDAEVKAFEKALPELWAATLPLEVNLHKYGPGDDDSHGWYFDMLYNAFYMGLYGLKMVRIQGGLGFGTFTLKGRDHRGLEYDGAGNITAIDSVKDYGYTFVGFPLRITGFVTPQIAPFVGFDWNIMSIPAIEEEDRSPSLLRAGVELHLNPLFVRGEMTSHSVHPDDMSFFGEVGLEF